MQATLHLKAYHVCILECIEFLENSFMFYNFAGVNNRNSKQIHKKKSHDFLLENAVT